MGEGSARERGQYMQKAAGGTRSVGFKEQQGMCKVGGAGTKKRDRRGRGADPAAQAHGTGLAFPRVSGGLCRCLSRGVTWLGFWAAVDTRRAWEKQGDQSGGIEVGRWRNGVRLMLF